MKTTTKTLSPAPRTKRPRTIAEDPRIYKGGKRKIDAILVSDAKGNINSFSTWKEAAIFYGVSGARLQMLENQTIQDYPPQRGRFVGFECVVLEAA